MKTFQDLRGGDTVKFRVHAGVRLNRGKPVTDWSVRVAKVNPLLVFADHVVVNHGNNGTVVDRHNFISQVIV